jgi:MOSC domain-containing protein YiiM
MSHIHMLFVGQPRTIGQGEGSWRSSINRQERWSPQYLTEGGFQWDAVADTKHHGGPHKAVCAYPLEHYAYWQQHATPGIRPGGFGENLTLSGLTEADVCIGDRYLTSGAIMEVSQPRIPCWKPARRWQVDDLTTQMQQTGYTGWYFRVIRPSSVAAGEPLMRLKRPNPGFTIAALNALNYGPEANPERAAAFAALPQLAPPWKKLLRRKVKGSP